MARFGFKLILCLLLALAAGFGFLALRSGDAFYSFYEWISPARFQQYDKLISSVGAEHQLDPMLVKAVVWRESRFDREKVGSAGERGLMQVSPKAANEWARENKIADFKLDHSAAFAKIYHTAFFQKTKHPAAPADRAINSSTASVVSGKNFATRFGRRAVQMNADLEIAFRFERGSKHFLNQSRVGHSNGVRERD